MSRIFVAFIVVILFSCTGTGNKKPQLITGSGIRAKNGMVVSAHPEGSRIGAEILKEGGNAVDAAVATGFALAVCYPEAGNIGGGGFMVFRLKDGTTDAIDFREKAPGSASRDMYQDKSGKVIDGLSTDTHLASGVPGSVEGLIEAHKKYGKLPFEKVIQPAIDLAKNGYKLIADQAASFNSNRKNFRERNAGKNAFVKDSLWKEGDLFCQPDLAKTLENIRDKGRDGFYSGPAAEMIIKEMKRGNGIVSPEDLSAYRAVWRKPLSTDYRGFEIITIPPPSSGGVTLIQLLEMVENFNLMKMGFHSASSLHLVIEAERRAFADRAEYLGDPDFVNVPVAKLLASRYLKDRLKDFDSTKASLSSEIKPGNLSLYESEETTHYSVVDSSGNAVSVTTTLNGTFGNSIVVEGAGFLLNNEMDDFSSKPGFPNMYGLVGGEANSIQPGKRMLSSMTPTIVARNGKLFMVVGSPGGSTIPTSVFQVIINVIDYGMGIQDAVNAPRFHHQWLPENVGYEKTVVDSSTLVKLTNMGHVFRLRSAIGRVNAITVSEDGTLNGGADIRGNNAAAGY